MSSEKPAEKDSLGISAENAGLITKKHGSLKDEDRDVAPNVVVSTDRRTRTAISVSRLIDKDNTNSDKSISVGLSSILEVDASIAV